MQSELSVLGSTRITVGLSQIVRVMPTAYQYAEGIKIFSGGGTLEICNPALSGSSTAGTSHWGTGYPIGASEVVNLGGPAVFYLAATGATMVATVLLGYTAGATVL
jgi:hypothetical protein